MRLPRFGFVQSNQTAMSSRRVPQLRRGPLSLHRLRESEHDIARTATSVMVCRTILPLASPTKGCAPLRSIPRMLTTSGRRARNWSESRSSNPTASQPIIVLRGLVCRIGPYLLRGSKAGITLLFERSNVWQMPHLGDEFREQRRRIVPSPRESQRQRHVQIDHG